MKPYYDKSGITLYQGDTRQVMRQLPEQSVHCCVTSPPYWGLRDYGVEGQLGLEATPEEFVENMVGVFREVWRVLRDDATLWLNLGDSYAAGGRSEYDADPKMPQRRGAHRATQGINTGLKPKNLCGIPWRLAFALQADGWYLRSDIIWSKPNPMPESVTDRPTKAHEYLFLLTKKARYFYDAEAVREAHTTNAASKMRNKASEAYNASYPGGRFSEGTRPEGHPSGRNRRTVWTIATQPYPGAHFATFPEKLVEPCILAGTSERGCCPECGAPWGRVVAKGPNIHPGSSHDHSKDTQQGNTQTHQSGRPAGTIIAERWHSSKPPTTTDWYPTCACQDVTKDGKPVKLTTIPCTVLDPFAGSFTVGAVAKRFGRHAVGVDLSEDYCALAVERIRAQETLPL